MKISAGILCYRVNPVPLFFMVRPGGPLWVNVKFGHWGIPKGEVDSTENMLDCAVREFTEETGCSLPSKNLTYLDTVQYKSKSKLIHCWAIHDQYNEVNFVKSNTFKLEWPRGSGIVNDYPEIAEGRFLDMSSVRKLVKSEQQQFVERLIHILH